MMYSRFGKSILASVFALTLTLAAGAMAQEAKEKTEGVTITELDGKLRVDIDGALFTEYHYADVPRPYFYPVIGPTGKSVVRNWPMKEGVAGEETDHPHHRSLWFTHGDVNGIDFWSEKKKWGTVDKNTVPRIVHEEFLTTRGGESGAIIISKNKWVAPGGKVVCTDRRFHRIQNTPEGIIFDFAITIEASEGKVVLGDTKEGSMSIRLAPTMRVKGEVAKGHIINSEGVKDGDTWGKRAAWVDYYGPVDGETVGVAIFDHPSNPRHPTWWHVRDYGLFAANALGIHYFEGKEKGAGDMTIEEGEITSFRYRFFFHKGDEKEGGVAEQFKKFAETPTRRRTNQQ